MKISEHYFQGLLNETNAIEAVSTLAGFWANRLDQNVPNFGVSKTEWIAQLILVYTGEIMNGGHSQFFLNRGKKQLFSTLSALNKISICGCARILSSASTIVGDDTTLTNLSSSGLNELHKLDSKAWEHLADIDSVLLRFLKKNEFDLLVQERGK